jgi:uracil-DNA glycosylase family 4
MNRENSLQNFSDSIGTSNHRQCKACGLYLNQLPVVDNTKRASVFWVGLSSVFIPEDEEKLPLSPYTRSGALINKIEQPFINEISFYKTNIVKCLPLNNNKIRYPFKHEMEKCYPNLETEIEILNPSFVFLLGKQVATFVLEKHSLVDAVLDENFNYNAFVVDNVKYISNDAAMVSNDARSLSNDARSLSNGPRSLSNDARQVSNGARQLSNDANHSQMARDHSQTVRDHSQMTHDHSQMTHDHSQMAQRWSQMT